MVYGELLRVEEERMKEERVEDERIRTKKLRLNYQFLKTKVVCFQISIRASRLMKETNFKNLSSNRSFIFSLKSQNYQNPILSNCYNFPR